MSWTELTWGKYRSQRLSLPQVALRDPDWFFWAYENKHFRSKYLNEASWIQSTATAIRIPDNEKGKKYVEYSHRPGDARFSHAKIVTSSNPDPLNRYIVCILRYIDLSIPYRLNPYDKQGNNLLLTFLKEQVFGDKHYRLTRKRCEDFFDGRYNFMKRDRSGEIIE